MHIASRQTHSNNLLEEIRYARRNRRPLSQGFLSSAHAHWRFSRQRDRC